MHQRWGIKLQIVLATRTLQTEKHAPLSYGRRPRALQSHPLAREAPPSASGACGARGARGSCGARGTRRARGAFGARDTCGVCGACRASGACGARGGVRQTLIFFRVNLIFFEGLPPGVRQTG